LGPYVHAYDLVGNLLSKTDRKGNTIQYLYDALYRLTQKTYPDTTNVEYAYDLANKVLQVNDPAPTALPTTTWDGWWARARSMRSWRVRRSQMPKCLHLRCGIEPHFADGAGRQRRDLRLRHLLIISPTPNTVGMAA
jgi:YD repeat-containing protein